MISPRSLFLGSVLVIVVALFGGLAVVLLFYEYKFLPACMSVHHGMQHPRRPERVGNQTQVLQKSSQYSQMMNYLSSLLFLFLRQGLNK